MALVVGSVAGALAQEKTVPQPPAPTLPAMGAPRAPGTPATPLPPSMGPGGAARPMPMMRDRTDMLARVLNLTDEQKEKVRPILEEEQKKMTEVREQTQAKLKPLLTPEQWEKFAGSPLSGQRVTPIVTRPSGMPPVAPAPPPVPPAPSK
jgi:Spy/CpxP family protein refolding chaperone